MRHTKCLERGPFKGQDATPKPTIQMQITFKFQFIEKKSMPYVVKGNQGLIDQLASERTVSGFTATNVGFYGPQSRKIRLAVQEVFSEDNFRGHIVWRSMTPSGFKGKTSLGRSAKFGSTGKVADSFNANNPKSDIRFEIDKLFKENNITIPFPQRDIHIIRK